MENKQMIALFMVVMAAMAFASPIQQLNAFKSKMLQPIYEACEGMRDTTNDVALIMVMFDKDGDKNLDEFEIKDIFGLAGINITTADSWIRALMDLDTNGDAKFNQKELESSVSQFLEDDDDK